MGIFDEIDKAMKKVEDEVKNADLDRQFRNLGDGIGKAGSDISRGINNAQAPADTAGHSPAPARAPHPGYARITAWVRTRYRSKIDGAVGDPYQKRLELEQMTAEATNGRSAKARTGFLDYLKKQNYEQLLR
jgi:hypothetical protein